jgi:hypothetical protein
MTQRRAQLQPSEDYQALLVFYAPIPPPLFNNTRHDYLSDLKIIDRDLN